MTVKEVTDGILKLTGVEIPDERTCDHLVVGDPDRQVTGIVSTFMVTMEVLRKTVEAGANLIITHEPTHVFERRIPDPFFRTTPVFDAMNRIVEEHGISIWRFHDHMHAAVEEDGIYRGLEKEIGWARYRMPPVDGSRFNHFGACYEIPETTLSGLADFFKEKMEMKGVRIVGRRDTPVRRVGILVGGGSQGLGDPLNPLKIMEERDLNVIVCGEIMELLSAAFVREMSNLGYDRSMLILGHERSEESGMKYLGEWISPVIGEIPVTFVDSRDPFDYL